MGGGATVSNEEESTELGRLDTPNPTSVTDLQSNGPVWSNQRACLCLHSGKRISSVSALPEEQESQSGSSTG